MNAERHKTLLQMLLILFVAQIALADSARISTNQGNQLYGQGKFDEAIGQYDQALIYRPEALEPKFNKANSYYRLDDLEKAINLYREVAAESKDMKLVTKARYNLGNCSFQQGSKQRDSNLQKAIEEMETAIGHWRAVLDIEPENEKAAKNIEVARLIIKDILDQLKNQQQQDPNRPQDPNQQQQNQQYQQNQQQQVQDPNQNQQQQGKDPNQPQDPNQQQAQKQQEQQKQDDEKKQAPDTTAQEILDKEQRDKKQRQILQRARYQKVEKDW
jgi:Ca-activated chloride channel family protein